MEGRDETKKWTLIGWLNYYIVQYLFIRIAWEEQGGVVKYYIMYFVQPRTGWEGEDYKFFFKKAKYLRIL